MDIPIILSGSANRPLAEAVSRALDLPLGQCEIKRFPDGEISVRLLESVRRKELFIIQPTAPPVNDHLIELLLLIDTCRRAAAGRITAIIPYFGYGRSDKRHGRREPIGASMVAHLLQSVSVDHVVTLDLHTPQIEGFFHAAVDSLTAVPTLTSALREQLPSGEVVVVAPDAGRVKMATAYAERLDAEVAVLHKKRISGSQTEVTHLVGDVSGRTCLLIDDMISTGGTIVNSVEALLDAGARPQVIVAATHALLLGNARQKLDQQTIARIWVTDSVSVRQPAWPKLSVVSIAPLIAGAIQRFMVEGSLSDLF